MKKENDIGFRIKNIELIQSNLSSIDNEITIDTIFKFNINIDHLVNSNEKCIVVKPSIEIFTDKSNTILGMLSANVVFEFENLNGFIINDELKLPNDIFIAINSISISTIRGILFSSFRGTILHNAILPVIDPKAFSPKE